MTGYKVRKRFAIGQRVMASFGGEERHIGVVSSTFDSAARGNYSVSVQFAPCSAHYGCQPDAVYAYGDKGGWTNEEYRIEREKSYCWEHAASVERERIEKYPDAPFSAFQGYTLNEVLGR